MQLRRFFFAIVFPILLLALWIPQSFAQQPETTAAAKQDQPAAKTSSPKETWKTVEELWYALDMLGSKAGWSSTITQSNGTQFRTISDMTMKINRGALPIEITMHSVFTETAQGKPVTAEQRVLMAKQAMESKWIFRVDNVEVITNQGGREVTKTEPLPEGEWLTPRAVERYVNQHREAGDELITYRTIDLQNGLKPITATTKRTGKGTLESGGKSIDVTIWTSTTDVMPIDSIEKIDSAGKVVQQETTIPGLGKMESRLTTKALAMSADDAPAPELLLQTFIKPEKPIEDSMHTVRAKLRVTVKDGVMPALPSAGAQHFEKDADGKSAILTIDINENQPASAEDIANKDYLTASPMVDSNDELIQKLAKRATARSNDEPEASADVMKRAEALRRLVGKHISRKGMETAFASASETAKTRTGDCSEHGVLLAALLRADGIPARVATGLVYVDSFAGHEGIFGWHMWTQALIDGKWVDFDATLPRRYNAVHVLTSTSSLNNGLVATDMASVVQLIGNLKIDVIEVKHE